jgi:hypothetical protein
MLVFNRNEKAPKICVLSAWKTKFSGCKIRTCDQWINSPFDPNTLRHSTNVNSNGIKCLELFDFSYDVVNYRMFLWSSVPGVFHGFSVIISENRQLRWIYVILNRESRGRRRKIAAAF